MKKYLHLFFAIACISFLNRLSAQKKYQRLVWQEEFNYTGLPDVSKWSYETGFVRNKESQYYTKARPENVYVDDGCLHIVGKKERFVNKQYIAGSDAWRTKDSLAHYTSAAIVTKGLHTWKYGKIVVRAKLPKGQGVWPAIWMLGAKGNWPKGGEIDIMEFIGKEPTHIYGTVHYASEAHNGYSSSGGVLTINDLDTAFHNYAIEWNKCEMKFLVDDNVYHRFEIKNANYKGRNPFKKRFYLLINLALGGAWGGAVSDAVLPQTFLVDFVRIYK